MANARFAAYNRGLLRCGTAACVLLTALPAAAQEIGAPPLEMGFEDIIVTATRRATKLQETPVSVTAYSGSQLQEQRIQNADDLFTMIPNSRSASVNGIDKIPSIRGLNISDSSPGIDRPIAVFIDDVYYSNGTTYLSDLYDVDQLQVLRGPQGTTFGRNATGGAVVVTTRRPEFETGAGLSFTMRSVPGVEVGAFYNAELVPGELAVRITASLKRAESTADNVAKPTVASRYLGGADTTVLRGQLRWKPSDRTDVLLNSSLNFDDTPPLPTQYVLIGPRLPTLVPMWPTNPNKFSIATPQAAGLTSFVASLKVEHEMDWATLTSITAYRRTSGHLSVSAVAENGNRSPLSQTNHLADREYSQEFRLSSPARQEGLEWIVGVYYLNLNDSKEQVYTFDPVPGALFAAIQNPGVSINYQRVRTESLAPFVEGVYHFTPAVGLRLGARYTHEEKSGRQIHSGIVGAVNRPPYDIPLEGNWNAFTPRAILEIKPTEDIFLFGGASRGFKGGGWSMSVLNPVLAARPIDPEKIWSYEVGMKSSWLDRRLLLNIAGFRADTKDLQARVYDPLNAVYNVYNAATVRAQGIEVETMARVTDELTLQANYGYLDSKYRDFVGCVVGRNCAGLRTPFAPKHSLSAAARYMHGLDSGATINASIETQYASKMQMDPVNGAVPATVIDKSDIKGLINASIGWTSADEKWKLSLWGKNITNKRVVYGANNVAVHAFSAAELASGSGVFKAIYNEPVSYGLTLSWAMR